MSFLHTLRDTTFGLILNTMNFWEGWTDCYRLFIRIHPSRADTLANHGPASSLQRINGISPMKPSTFWTNYSDMIIKNVSRRVKPKRNLTLVRTELYQETLAKLV